jgi:predicted Rossmann fold nucleotide-binding protein DprA/Smf involved in DNA uptake
MYPRIEYEFRFAVTGHRRISDEGAVTRAIEGVIDRINRLIEDAGATQACWTIVSPLARGADQIAAKTLMERAHARLEVLTPFPLSDYRKDFSLGSELASF